MLQAHFYHRLVLFKKTRLECQLTPDPLKNDKILNSLFKGDKEFDDPYFATWFLIDDELTQKIPTNFTFTKGSSSGGNNPTVVFKPLR